MPIEIPSGPGGHDRGKPELPAGSCYLCEAVGGRTEKAIVEETELTLTIVNWAQFEVGQVYVIPKRHAPTILDLTEEEAASVIQTVRRTEAALVRAYDPDGINVIQNNGVVAGQDAPHFHMHVVPRRKVGSDWGSGPLPSPHRWGRSCLSCSGLTGRAYSPPRRYVPYGSGSEPLRPRRNPYPQSQRRESLPDSVTTVRDPDSHA